MATPVDFKNKPPTPTNSLPGEMESCLRSLQDDLKVLRSLQLTGNKPNKTSSTTSSSSTEAAGKKKASSKKFLAVQRKLFHALVKLRAILLKNCHGGATPNNNFLSKTGELVKLQGPSEKLLRGLVERLGSWASHGGFSLTPAIYTTVAHCLDLIYTHGSTRSLLDSMCKWEELLNDKMTTINLRIALFHCAETLFVSHSKSVVSYIEPFIVCAAKQFKLVSGNDVGSGKVRSSAVRCIGRSIASGGISAGRHHQAALKVITRACSDRSAEVRRAAAGALIAVANSAYEWCDFNPEKSVTVEQLLTLSSKGMDDVDGNHFCQLAFGRCVGITLGLAIQQTSIDAGSSSGSSGARSSTGMGGDGGGGGDEKKDHGSGKSGDTSGKNSKTKKRSGFGALSSTFLKSSKKEVTQYNVTTAFDYLRSKFVKPASIRRHHIGSAHGMVALLRSGYVFDNGSGRSSESGESGKSKNSTIWSIVIDGLLKFAVLSNSNGVEVPITRLRPILFILEQGLIGSGRGENDLQQLLKYCLIRLLKNLKQMKQLKKGKTSSSDNLLNSTQITMLLIIVTRCVASLGDAALGVCVSPVARKSSNHSTSSKRANVGVVDILYAFSSTPSRLVRTEVASCCRTLMSALPSLGVPLLNDFMAAMAKNHAELVTLASTSRQSKPSDQEKISATRILLGLKGRSMAVAGLLYALPSCILGVPHSTSSEVLYLGTAFLHHHSDGMLIPSASNACAAAGWMMISGLFAGMGISALQPHFASLFQVFEEVFPAGAAPRSLGVAFETKDLKYKKNQPQHELEAILAAATALMHLMRSWPSMNEERPDLMVRAASCIINLVASLDSPDASLKACRDGVAPDGEDANVGQTTMTSHVLFLTIHALTLEMCALLPLDQVFLRESFPRFAASFPSLLASTSKLLRLGTYGENTLLSTNCLLNNEDMSLQNGSQQWQSSSHLGPISQFGGESGEKESFLHGISCSWGSTMVGYGGSGKGNSTRGCLTETEQEIAVIESMLWTSPIIADASGKGGGRMDEDESASGSGSGKFGDSTNSAEYPRRNHNKSMPSNVQPAPVIMERLVDAAISLFGRIFPYQNSHQRHHLLTQLIDALKESQSNKSQIDDLTYATIASKSARNIVAALLCTIRHLQHGDPELICLGPDESISGEESIMTLIPATSRSGTDGGADLPWLMTFRAILKSALSSNDVLVRRASSAAMGCLTAIVGGVFSRKVLRSLVNGIKGGAPSHRAGSALALACHYRLADESSELDSVLYDLARETREPVRSFALHSWWVLLKKQTRDSLQKNPSTSSGSSISASNGGFIKYVKPTLALVEAHLLSPSLGMSRNGETVEVLDHLTYPDKDMTIVARSIQVGVLRTIGRLVNTLLFGLGQSGLSNWIKEGGNTSKKQMMLMWSTWMVLRESPEELVMIEAMNFVWLMAKYYPEMLYHDTRFSTFVVPWLDSVLYDDADEIGDEEIDQTMPVLSSIDNTSVSLYSQPRTRHSKDVQSMAVKCFLQMSKCNEVSSSSDVGSNVGGKSQMAMLVVKRLFHVVNREQSNLHVSRSVVPSLPFGATTGETAPAECVPTIISPLVGLQGRGLFSIHASHLTSIGDTDGLSLVEECRQALLSLSIMNRSEEWTDYWMKICEDVIFAKKGDDNNEDDKDDSSDEEDNGDVTSGGKENKQRESKSVVWNSPTKQMSKISVWPIKGNGPRWRSKMIAMECLQLLLRDIIHNNNNSSNNVDRLTRHLKKIVKMSCFATTSTVNVGILPSPLGIFQTLGMTLIRDIVGAFADTKEEGKEEEDDSMRQPLLLLYEAQLSAAMRSAFEGPEDAVVVVDNAPLALHACAPMAAMLACGISQDPVMARRTIKTLVSGDSGSNGGGGGDDQKKSVSVSLTTLPPKPPESTGHQEYVGTCKLAARLAALAELQLATIPSDFYSWWSTNTSMSTSIAGVLVNVNEGMRKALNKTLRPHLPILREHWLAMLRDQVSLRARARAVRGRRSSMSSDTMYVIPAPKNSLLQHNEDSGQTEPMFDRLWPSIVQSVSSLVGTDQWKGGCTEDNEDEDNSIHLVLGICLRFLSNGPSSIKGMTKMLKSTANSASTSSNNSPTSTSRIHVTLLPTGMRCMHALYWCMSAKIPIENNKQQLSHVAKDLVKAIVCGIGAPENSNSSSRSTFSFGGRSSSSNNNRRSGGEKDAMGGRVASFVLINSLLNESIRRAKKKGGKKKKKEEGKSFVVLMDYLFQEIQDPSYALPDHTLSHSLLEWGCRSLQEDLPGMITPVNGVAGTTGMVNITKEQYLLSSLAVDLINTVICNAHSDVIEQYHSNMMSIVLRCFRLMATEAPWSGGEISGENGERDQFLLSLRKLHNTLWEYLLSSDSLHALSTMNNIRTIVNSLLCNTSSPRGICAVLSLASGTVYMVNNSGGTGRPFTFGQFVDDLSMILNSSNNSRSLGVFMYCKKLLFNQILVNGNPVQLNDEEYKVLMANVGPLAAEACLIVDDLMLSTHGLIVVGVAAGKDCNRLLTCYLKILCDTIKVHGKDEILRKITLSMLRLHGESFKKSVQELPGNQQNVLQSFLREAMKEEAAKKSRHTHISDSGGVKRTKKKKSKKKKLKL